MRPSRSAISVSVPPSTTGTSARAYVRSLGSRLAVTRAVPQPSLTRSTLGPLTSSRPSASAHERPLSSTCVTPRSRGLELRSGRSRKPANAGLLRLVGADGDDHERVLSGDDSSALVDRLDRVRPDTDDPCHDARLVLVARRVGDHG